MIKRLVFYRRVLGITLCGFLVSCSTGSEGNSQSSISDKTSTPSSSKEANKTETIEKNESIKINYNGLRQIIIKIMEKNIPH